MSADYTIQSVQPAQVWQNDYGSFQPYDLELTGPEAPEEHVTLNRKMQDGAVPADKVPKPGQVIYGSIKKDRHGYRFKTEQRDGPAPQVSQNGSSGDGPSEEYWEAKNRAIQRQATHKVMCQVYELGRTEGSIPKAETKEDFFAQLIAIADWLDRDTDRARDTFDPAIPEAPSLT